MERLIRILLPVLFVMAGCGGGKQSTDNFITVDVTASYPEKELILQDFLDVEYIPLETTNEFLTQGYLQAVGEEIIVVRNWGGDGDIFIFDRKTGKGLKKINRKGQGGEEYSQAGEVVLDEENHELFVEDYQARKIWVYDLSGNYKRNFHSAGAGYSYYLSIFHYDRDHLICYQYHPSPEEKEENRASHLIISKQDGSITREIQFPFKEVKTPTVREGEGVATVQFHPSIPSRGAWILMNTSSDTVYACLPDGAVSPFIVRTPSIQSMEPEIFLFPQIFTDRYYLMKTMKKEFDFATMQGYPSTGLLYDRQEKALFEYAVRNNDFLDRREVDLRWGPVNHEIATWQPLQAHELVEAYEEGKLKGRLKEIAAGLDEESNPVLMLAKYRK